ncbi:MAG: MerR family transcriptional regulator [Vagococcus sp.]|uniref:MerR family transcriptional regulator n=1 Tax=Vagococcus sp. TaxID=1933889 RepID=UPI002FCA68E3
MDKYVTISQLAKLFDINQHTIRHYEDKELLQPALIDKNGYRKYDVSKAYDLAFILLFKQLDLSLKEIKEMKKLNEPKESIHFFEEKLIDIDQKISDLQQVKENISHQLTLLNQDFTETSLEIKNPIYLKKLIELKHEEEITLQDILKFSDAIHFFSNTICYKIKEATYDVFYLVDEKLLDSIPSGNYKIKWLFADNEKELNCQLEKVSESTYDDFYVLEEIRHLVTSHQKLAWKVMIRND